MGHIFLGYPQGFHAPSKLIVVASGLITGVAGAAGDLGGIVYLLIARYNGNNYAKVFWVVGVVNITASLLIAWIRPVSKEQLKAR